jgi:hypothetical protein
MKRILTVIALLFATPMLAACAAKKPFFEKSAINETSFEWTGVDGHLAQQLAQSTTTYRLLDAGNLATNVVKFFSTIVNLRHPVA